MFDPKLAVSPLAAGRLRFMKLDMKDTFISCSARQTSFAHEPLIRIREGLAT